MRLWHKDMVPYLPTNRLTGQWREVIAIQGILDKHGKLNHSTINKIMDYDSDHFVTYARLVYAFGVRRGYSFKYAYLTRYEDIKGVPFIDLFEGWHNNSYLTECMDNLENKVSQGKMYKSEWKVLTDIFVRGSDGLYSKKQ